MVDVIGDYQWYCCYCGDFMCEFEEVGFVGQVVLVVCGIGYGWCFVVVIGQFDQVYVEWCQYFYYCVCIFG